MFPPGSLLSRFRTNGPDALTLRIARHWIPVWVPHVRLHASTNDHAADSRRGADRRGYVACGSLCRPGPSGARCRGRPQTRAQGDSGGRQEGHLRQGCATDPQEILLRLPRGGPEQGGGVARSVQGRGGPRRRSRDVAKGADEYRRRVDAPDRQASTFRGRADACHRLARTQDPVARLQRSARSGTRHRAPPQPHRIQQHRPRLARDRFPTGRGFSGRRCRLRIRQHR